MEAMRVIRSGDERGVALLMALVTAALVTAVATTMVMSSSTDLLITGSNRAAAETMYAAEAAAHRAIGELATIADWGTVLAPPPATVGSFDDGLSTVTTADGRVLSIAGLTTMRQAMSARTYGPGAFGGDSPVWRLFGHAELRALLPTGVASPPAYVLIWVADDGGDGDADPAVDANGQLLGYVDAYGVSGAHRSVELAVARVTPGTIRVLSWKDPR